MTFRLSRFLLCALLFTLLLAQAHTIGQAVQQEPAPVELDIAKVLEQTIKEHHLAGMAAVVVRSDSVAGIGAAGIKHEGQSTPINVHDLFHLGSNTKAMTATMIARLIEAGKLSWTTTPLDVFPEMKNEIHPAFKSITIEQLFSHYAGIPPYTDTDSREFKQLPKLDGSAAEQRLKFAQWVLKHEPVVTPGTKAVYSNAGYALVAAIAERVTGSTWEALMVSQVFDPLGIHAIFEWPATWNKDQPWGHVETKKGLRPQDPNDKGEQLPLFLLPAGGVAMSMDDYGKFLQEHLKGLEGKPGKLLSPETIKRLHTAPMHDKYALGWGVQQINDVPSSVHAGSDGTFYAVVAVQPSRDTAVAVVANSGGERSSAGCSAALKALLGQFAKDR
ncbi:MAG TPA: serine hydrolase domain-containing protein [Candidatus Angelobacter sp.]|jgi:CubicO group peptidase (beta-lactamase class C family)|nr:serine hydrolase domain-containing protein [Candidatus Angelobacter sp.]